MLEGCVRSFNSGRAIGGFNTLKDASARMAEKRRAPINTRVFFIPAEKPNRKKMSICRKMRGLVRPLQLIFFPRKWISKPPVQTIEIINTKTSGIKTLINDFNTFTVSLTGLKNLRPEDVALFKPHKRGAEHLATIYALLEWWSIGVLGRRINRKPSKLPNTKL